MTSRDTPRSRSSASRTIKFCGAFWTLPSMATAQMQLARRRVRRQRLPPKRPWPFTRHACTAKRLKRTALDCSRTSCRPVRSERWSESTIDAPEEGALRTRRCQPARAGHPAILQSLGRRITRTARNICPGQHKSRYPRGILRRQRPFQRQVASRFLHIAAMFIYANDGAQPASLAAAASPFTQRARSPLAEAEMAKSMATGLSARPRRGLQRA